MKNLAAFVIMAIVSGCHNANATGMTDNNRTNRGSTFCASSVFSVVSNATVSVALGSELFARYHEVSASLITNLIEKVDGSTPYQVPSRKQLQDFGLSRWSLPNPWMRFRFSDADGTPIAWLQFHGGAVLFSWGEIKYSVGKKTRKQVAALLNDIGASVQSDSAERSRHSSFSVDDEPGGVGVRARK